MKILLLNTFFLITGSLIAQKNIKWVSTSSTNPWKEQQVMITGPAAANADVEINPRDTLQFIEGFGTCFNELGWTSLSVLSAADRESIMKELFEPGTGAISRNRF